MEVKWASRGGEERVEAKENGSSIMRPMFYEFSDDKVCYTLEDQYMFGEDILFAPIYNEGETKRMVYLPKGNWVRTTDKTVVAGGQFIECSAEINEFIAFVKEGAEIINVF